MDPTTFFATLFSSIGISIPAAAWLSRKFVEHRLAKDLDDYRHALDKARDEWQGMVRKEVENALGDAAADRDYRLNARKRLYEAIGPLRFQLMLACRDFSRRIRRHGIDNAAYRTVVAGYYGGSTLYRLLRPFAITELIERQVAFADFAVDPAATELLRFRRALTLAFTDGAPILGHPAADWNNQVQHVFSDNVRRAGNALITRENKTYRVRQYEEFLELLRTKPQGLDPFPAILNDFSIASKPLFWVRLITAGYICNHFVTTEGRNAGFAAEDFPVETLLAACTDDYVAARQTEYAACIRKSPTIEL